MTLRDGVSIGYTTRRKFVHFAFSITSGIPMNKYKILFQNSPVALVLSFFILCTIGGYSFLNQMSPQQIVLKDNSHDPDAFLTKVTAFYLNKEGKLQTQFKSPRMLHYYLENKTEFENPHFLIYTNNNSPWHIFALHGQAIAGIESVKLWDNVRIHQDQSKTNHELNLQTNMMTLHPKTQTANTDQPVLVIQPGYQVSATGVQLSLKEEKVDLMSDAKGEFSANFLNHPAN